MKADPIVVGLFATLLLSACAAPAEAHERDAVGRYAFTVGWQNEPPTVDAPNAITIEIMDKGPSGGAPDASSMSGMSGMTPSDGTRNAYEPGMDLSAHGALFASGDLPKGGAFNFTFGPEFRDVTVPYHDHLTGQTGSIMVMDGANRSGTAHVRLTDTGFDPASLAIQPNTTVMWMNMKTGSNNAASDAMISSGRPGGSMAASSTGRPLIGAENALAATLATGPKSKTFDLTPSDDSPGLYLVRFTPTVPGAYTVHVTGMLNGTMIDLVAHPEEVHAGSAVQWPVNHDSGYDLQMKLDDQAAQIKALEVRVPALEASKSSSAATAPTRSVPAPASFAALAALGVAVALAGAHRRK